MQPENQPRVPVISTEGLPLIPCRPKRARVLLRDGRATKTWINGNFAIQMTDRTRAESVVPETTMGITPGSKLTGFAITLDRDETQERRVIHAMELEHIGHRISMQLQKRASNRRNRRHRLRYRQPRFDNRSKQRDWLPPSIRHNLEQINKWTGTLTRLYPISSIRISNAKFDIQLMENPDIQGEEYQHGTLYGWQLRAYVFHQNHHRCFYCGQQESSPRGDCEPKGHRTRCLSEGKQLTLDHVIPKSRGGTDRVANLTAACKKCNDRKNNRLPEEFLKNRPDKLRQLLDPEKRHSYRDAGWMNVMMPFILENLAGLGMPVEQTNAALTSWNRKQMQLPKTHCIDAAVLGNCQSLLGMPELVAHVRPSNGRRKRKANVVKNGTPTGDDFLKYCRLSPRERSRTPTPGHAGRRRHFGPELIGTGDIVTIQHHELGPITGRAVMTDRGEGIKIRGEHGELSGRTGTARLVRRNPGYIRTMVRPKPTG